MNLLVTITALISAISPVPRADTVAVSIEPVSVVLSLKQGGDYDRQPVMATSLRGAGVLGGPVVGAKDLSLAVPGMLHADYGSRMTGSIYVRGLGSRMDQPSMGLYVDGVPVLSKNNYDFDYFDLRSVDILRGPQGTLYGRNAIGGVIDIQTLSPFDFQGVRLGAGYGNADTWQARAAIYRRPTRDFGWSLSLHHSSTDGFFTNAFDGSRADSGHSSAARFKLQGRLGGGWTVENSLSAGLVRQAGFAYAPLDETTGRVGPIDHNDPCSYDRLNLVEGLTFRYSGPSFRLVSTTGWQYTDDEMALDQDFSPRSMFTLRQGQREHAFTQELTLRSVGTGRWEWISGLFGFARRVDMSAPVHFKRDGIDELILAGANAGIHTVFPDADLLIRQQSFPIHSDFRLPSGGLSLYHQSTWRAGRWSFTAGVRADWEHTAIRYENSTSIDYRFTLTMADYKPLPVAMSGHRSRNFLELMPRASVMLDTGAGTLYASVSRGYKAGGYNTQIFSDILQNRMMSDLMSDLGLYMDVGQSYDVEDAIAYEPERSWNYEIGGHLSTTDRRFRLDAALFWIDCRNQQLTVFPPGRGTGRLMSNAGRTRSLGAELTATCTLGDLALTGSWGHTDARFLDYNDGRADYSGNRVPYAPRNTLSVQAGYGIDLGVGSRAGRLTFGAGVQGAGRIMWNETNTLSQPFYTLLNATAGWERDGLAITLWGRNLTGTDYNTFYFRSVGHSFVQRAKPLQAGLTVSLIL